MAAILGASAIAGSAAVGSFAVTSDDLSVPFISTVTFYPINADGTLGAKNSVATGGHGVSGGYFAAARVIVVPSGSGVCVFASDGGTGDVAGIDGATETVVGNYYGAPTDSGTGNGIGLAAGAQYLYATYSTSSTIGTFQMLPGCALNFVGSIFAAGLNAGTADGMAVQGNMMVVTYGDGSIESFDVSGGVPVSHGDLQYSTGSSNDHLPNGVTITHGGRYAIFGDASTRTTIEVSDLSSGKLAPTVAYDLGGVWNSGNVRLSPDEKLIFVSNNSGAQVTAAFFDETTGKVTPGCSSGALKGYYKSFIYAGSIGFQLNTQAGGTLYVPEFGTSGKSFVALLNFVPNGTTCTIAESPNSPVGGATGSTILSLASYAAAP